ncbi:MAG: DoxX family membrane protein [Myxococcales bacterium FL481]|nr:MAG: DoxX family membrane protein [Myxococcales bacterium FL481]
MPVDRKHLVAIGWLARVSVAAVFVYAAIPKLIDPVGFAETISNYQVFPYWSWNALAVVVPVLELVGAATLLTGWKRQAGAAWLGALTCGFLVLIASVILRGIDINCGCFGASAEASSGVGWGLFWRDVALLAGIGLAARR